jgi:hypothetical protein
MTFLVPAALAALVLAAVPILLHLLRRRDVEERSFPALRYLPPDARRKNRTFRLRELILLALRVGALVLAVVGAARWILPVGAADHPPADLVLVLDDGIASAAVTDGMRILDAQLSLGRELLEALGPLDRVWVLGAASPDRPTRPVSPGAALELLALHEPEAAEARIEEAVRRGVGILAARPPGPREIVVLRSDGARLSAEVLATLPDGLPLSELDPGVPFPANRGITRVEIGSGLSPRAGESVELRVLIEGTDGPAPDEPVRLLLDGELRGASRTDPTGTARIVLPPAPAGTIEGRIEIDPDALRLDDAVAFRIGVVPPPDVQVRGEASPWLDAALAALAGAGRIAPPPGTGSGVPPGPNEGWSPWPGAAGGGAGLEVTSGALRILLPPSNAAELPAFNLGLEAAGIPLRLGPPTDGRSWTRTAPAPAFPPALAGIEVTRHYPVENPPRVLARLEDGDPWVLEWTAPGGDGAPAVVRIVSLPLVPAWSEIPLSAAMIPLVDRLLHPDPLPADGDPGPAVASPPPAPEPVVSSGAPGSGWTRRVLASRRGREATPFLAWLLFVILCTEGWLAGGPRARASGPAPVPREP